MSSSQIATREVNDIEGAFPSLQLREGGPLCAVACTAEKSVKKKEKMAEGNNGPQGERVSALKKKTVDDTRRDPLLNSPIVERDNKSARTGSAIAMAVSPPQKTFPPVPPFNGVASGSAAGNVPSLVPPKRWT